MAKKIVNDKTGLELEPPYIVAETVLSRVDQVDDNGNPKSISPIRKFRADLSSVEVDELLESVGQNALSNDEKLSPVPTNPEVSE